MKIPQNNCKKIQHTEILYMMILLIILSNSPQVPNRLIKDKINSYRKLNKSIMGPSFKT